MFHFFCLNTFFFKYSCSTESENVSREINHSLMKLVCLYSSVFQLFVRF